MDIWLNDSIEFRSIGKSEEYPKTKAIPFDAALYPIFNLTHGISQIIAVDNSQTLLDNYFIKRMSAFA